MKEDEEDHSIMKNLISSNNDMNNTRSTKKSKLRSSFDKQEIEMQYINEFDRTSSAYQKKNNSLNNIYEDNPEKPTHATNNITTAQNGSFQLPEPMIKLAKQTSYTINTNIYKNQFILRRFIQDVSQGINLACFCYFYCTTVTNSTQRMPFSGLVGYMIGSLTNLSMGSSRYVVYVPSFLAISFIKQLSETYEQGQIHIITAMGGVYLFLFSRYLDIQRLIFFVPAIVLLGYVYSMVFQFFFNYIDFTLGFRTFNSINDYLERLQSIYDHTSWESLVSLVLTAILVITYLIPQVKYTKYPWLSILLVVSLIVGIFGIDESQRHNIVKDLYQDTQPQWYDILSYLIKPITSLQSFHPFLLIESLQLAILIYLESLFTLNFSEKECSDRNIEPQREALVLSISNIISGLFCGIPVSAGIFSTTLNGVLIRRTSKYPRFISLVITILIEFIVIYFNLSIPYICFASVLVGVSIFTLYMNLHFHSNATQRNLEVWTQATIGFFYNPVISAILCTSYYLLQNELNRYTLQRRSINQYQTPNIQNKSAQKEKVLNTSDQYHPVPFLQHESPNKKEHLQTLPNRLTLDPQHLKQQQNEQRLTDLQLSQNIFNHVDQQVQNRQKEKKIVEKYNMLNDQVVEVQDHSQSHPNNFEESYLMDLAKEEFQENKFMLARYNEQNEDNQEYKQKGIESFLRTDSAFIIQIIEGEITNDYLKYIQEQISSKLYLSLEKYRGIILKFQNITFYDMNSLFQTKILMCFLSKKYLPVLVTGMPEQLAEDLFALNPHMFKSDSIILELKK